MNWHQNLASCPEPLKVIQKFTPSKQTPSGRVPGPVKKDPRGVKSADFQSETLSPPRFETIARCPSNAIPMGPFKPLPVRVARISPVEARTTDTEFDPEFGTQMFAPSKAGNRGFAPTATVCTMAAFASSLKRLA